MKQIKRKADAQEEMLLREIQRTKMALETAYSNFENCLDPDLIDSYIYEVNAVQKRYKFLLKQVKSLESENFAM